jgi:O-methyltransferase
VSATAEVARWLRLLRRRHPWQHRRDLSGDDAPGLYLDLLKKCLTRYIFEDGSLGPGPPEGVFDPAARAEGRDWPANAETMIGLQRLDNLQHCIVEVLRRAVPGDLIETGVWRGGAAIFMRAVLGAYGETERRVWLADSFEGLPRPDPVRYPADEGDPLWAYSALGVPLDEVKANFARYGLLDDQVRFLPGWFRDTLPSVAIRRLSILRLDGDMYESTIVALRSLYPKLSRGGFVIIDDYGAIPACRAAVDDFRSEHRLHEQLEPIDWSAVFWRRCD